MNFYNHLQNQYLRFGNHALFISSLQDNIAKSEEQESKRQLDIIFSKLEGLAYSVSSFITFILAVFSTNYITKHLKKHFSISSINYSHACTLVSVCWCIDIGIECIDIIISLLLSSLSLLLVVVFFLSLDKWV